MYDKSGSRPAFVSSLNICFFVKPGEECLYRFSDGGNFISSLNVSGCSKIASLNCSNADLSELNVSTLTALAELDCSSNKLKELDFSSNAKLEKVNATGNPLTRLWLAKGQTIGDLSVDNPDVITEKE